MATQREEGLKAIKEALEQNLKENLDQQAKSEQEYRAMGLLMRDAIASGDRDAQLLLKEMRQNLNGTIQGFASVRKQMEVDSGVEEYQHQLEQDRLDKEHDDQRGWFSKLGAEIAAKLQESNTKIGQVMGDQLQYLFGRDFKEKFNEFLTKTSEFLKGGARKVGGAIKEKAQSIFDFLVDLGKLVAAAVGFFGFLEGWEKASVWFGENADFGDKLASGLAGILGAFGLSEDYQKSLAEALSRFFHNIAEVFTGLFDMIVGIFTGDTGLIMDGVKQVFSGLIDIFAQVADIILGIFGTSIEGITNGAMGIIDSVVNWFSSIGDSIAGVFATIGDVGTSIYDSITGTVNQVIDWFKGLFDFELPEIDTKAVLRSFLPDPNSTAAMLIPDALFEAAGYVKTNDMWGTEVQAKQEYGGRGDGMMELNAYRQQRSQVEDPNVTIARLNDTVVALSKQFGDDSPYVQAVRDQLLAAKQKIQLDQIPPEQLNRLDSAIAQKMQAYEEEKARQNQSGIAQVNQVKADTTQQINYYQPPGTVIYGNGYSSVGAGGDVSDLL